MLENTLPEQSQKPAIPGPSSNQKYCRVSSPIQAEAFSMEMVILDLEGILPQCMGSIGGILNDKY